MKSKGILIVMFILTVSLLSCKSSSVGALTQTSNKITGILTFEPDPLIAMKTATLKLQLSDQNGNPIEGAHVSYDLTMPAMKMPPNQPQAIAQASGLYIAETTFSMSGDWQAAVTILQGEETTTLTFDFKVQ